MREADENHILSHCDGGVQILHIHRPDKKNALTGAMYRALADGIRHADSDAAVHVILLRGEDYCFTSGNDVNDFVAAEDRSSEPAAFLDLALDGDAEADQGGGDERSDPARERDWDHAFEAVVSEVA
jgi:enoyl-CoA hydratase/carnithine racemase